MFLREMVLSPSSNKARYEQADAASSLQYLTKPKYPVDWADAT